ncbi:MULTISPECIES: DUF5665 domain-containing protein [Bacillaceae]|uniref:Signal transduction histidine kinase n=1 Tax=Evansella alkalicola TaxID=745819 RepID=A0ABS6JPJ7_9BACI|nr:MULTISPECIES: DUF5665 domain-containing protein [Bacillaceae]MBU9720491.1 hypothetical protein [Bacillus alkalicola]
MSTNDIKDLEKIIHELEKYTRSLEKAEQLDYKLSRINRTLERSKIREILLNYTNPKRVFFINILVGIGRGLGLTIGTVIVLSLLGLILRQFVDVPLIGEWISNLLEYVNLDQHRS